MNNNYQNQGNANMNNNDLINSIIKSEQKSKITLVIFVGILALIIGLIIGIFINGIGLASSPKQRYLNEIYDKIFNEWYLGIDNENLDEELLMKAVNAMVDDNIDPYTYISKRIGGDEGSSYIGVGISVISNHDCMEVIEVYPSTPASIAGIKNGDLVISVTQNGITYNSSEYGFDLLDKTNKVKDSVITFNILRMENDSVVTKNLDVTLDNIELETVFLENSNKANTTIIKMTGFEMQTPRELEKILMTLSSNEDLVINLMHNPGGYVSSVINVVDLFLPKEKVVLKQVMKNGATEVNKTITDTAYTFKTITLLVDSNTASAAEVMTAALKYHLSNVQIRGTTTFGKGIAQATLTYGEYDFRYTYAKWLAPDDVWIHNIGIKPDIAVTPTGISSIYFANRNIENDYQKTIALNHYKYDDVDSVNIAGIQNYLKNISCGVNACLSASARNDGYYDLATVNAIKLFQATYQINDAVSGEIDVNTANYLRVAYANSRQINIRKFYE